jgi:glutathione synthase/RimK-type ligase-like ATP-grasp enzyme
MVQPFMPRILDEGEYSLFYFNGEYSHAILKVPAAGEFRSQEERGAEIRSVTPESLLRSRVEQAMATLHPAPLYARIDLVRDAMDDFRVMELELIEPSMYLRTEAGAPARFAQAIDDWVKRFPA